MTDQTFSILNPYHPAWSALFERLPRGQRDVFYTDGFARLCQQTLNREDEVHCAVFSQGDKVILYPFAKRNIGRLTGISALSDCYDITGLYGRGGLVSGGAGPVDLEHFHQAFADYCRNERIICGFDRFHPVMANERVAGPGARVIDVGGFVVVDLRPELEEIYASFKPSVRKDLRKAERHSVTCFSEAGPSYLMDFIEIYHATMQRNGATDFYYFTEDYFRSLCDLLAGQYHFYYATVADIIVSCELVLHHGKYAHSFLGGTRLDALPLSANPMLKWNIIRHLKSMGCEYFLLGGGTTPDDGVFNFKKAYAPEGVFASRIGGTVWDHQAYDKVKGTMMASGIQVLENRFQFYDLG